MSTERSILAIDSASICARAAFAGAGSTTRRLHGGVVNADLDALYQGTGMPFAGSGVVADVTTPRAGKANPSGTTTAGPPV